MQVRKRAFEKKFQIIVEKERHKDGTRRRTFSLHRTSNHELRDVAQASVVSGIHDLATGTESLEQPAKTELFKNELKTKALSGSAVADDDEGPAYPSHLTFSENTRFRTGSASRRSSGHRSRHSYRAQAISATRTPIDGSANSEGAEPRPTSRPSEHSATADRHDPGRYFDATAGWISRNSQFHGLTERERERLGGYEYRAVSLLAWLVPVYYILFQLLGCLGCGAWVAYNRPNTALENGLNPWWVGAFNAVSAFSK